MPKPTKKPPAAAAPPDDLPNTPPKRKRGRPKGTTRGSKIATPAVLNRVLEIISDGKSLHTASKEVGLSCTTLWDGLEREEFAERYAQARKERAAKLAEEALDIADENSRDWKEGRNGPVPDNEVVQRSKLRVDTRKWFAAVLDPRSYSPRHQITGPDGAPLQPAQQVTHVYLPKKDD